MAQMNASGFESEADVQGFSRPENGIYHCLISDVDRSCEKTDAIIVPLEVLAGTVDGQRGRKFQHRMRLADDGSYKETHLRFALAVGLIVPGEQKDLPLEAWDAIRGRQVVVSVENNTSEKDGKTYTNVTNYGMDVWGVHHPGVADVRKDATAAAMVPKPGTAPVSAPPAQAPTPPQAPSAPNAAAPEAMDGNQWKGLLD